METKRHELRNLLTSATQLAEELHHDLETDPVFRSQVIETSDQLKRTLQTPTDQAWEIFFQPHHLSILQTALDAGWLQSIADAGESGVSADGLASISGADVSLVRRLMRLLIAAGSIREVGLNKYAPTEISKLFCDPRMAAGLRHAGHDYAVSVSRMPEYFANNGYQAPPSAEYGVYSYARGASFLKHLSQRPDAAKQFNMFMSAARAGKKSWLDVFPVEKLQVAANDNVMLVDVGGGKGHDLAEFAAKQTSLGLKGKLVLQELDRVISQVPAEWEDLFAAQAHDFFSLQKEIHARAYYLHHILHGWADGDCIKILTHLRDAMKPNYSKLLINEMVLPDVGCPLRGAAFDVNMMAVVSGRERTELEWEKLIDTVGGLVINMIWAIEANGEGLIEITRVE